MRIATYIAPRAEWLRVWLQKRGWKGGRKAKARRTPLLYLAPGFSYRFIAPTFAIPVMFIFLRRGESFARFVFLLSLSFAHRFSFPLPRKFRHTAFRCLSHPGVRQQYHSHSFLSPSLLAYTYVPISSFVVISDVLSYSIYYIDFVNSAILALLLRRSQWPLL